MKRASKTIKKHVESLINVISEAVTPFGPGVTAVIVEDITADVISLVIFEMPTELLYGPMDGSEIFYGFSFNLSLMGTALDIKNISFINDEDGVSISLVGETIASPIKIIKIRIQSDPPEDVQVAQVLDIKNSDFSPRKLPDNVVAIIKGG